MSNVIPFNKNKSHQNTISRMKNEIEELKKENEKLVSVNQMLIRRVELAEATRIQYLDAIREANDAKQQYDNLYKETLMIKKNMEPSLKKVIKSIKKETN